MSTVFLISLILRLILTVHSHNSPLDEREILRKISLRSTTPENSSTLHVPPAGSSFKIALFADLHFGENAWTDWGPRQDVNSIKVILLCSMKNTQVIILSTIFFQGHLVCGLNYIFIIIVNQI